MINAGAAHYQAQLPNPRLLSDPQLAALTMPVYVAIADSHRWPSGRRAAESPQLPQRPWKSGPTRRTRCRCRSPGRWTPACRSSGPTEWSVAAITVLALGDRFALVSAPFWGETPPATPVSPSAAEAIAREAFGIDGTATPLGSNQETNLRSPGRVRGSSASGNIGTRSSAPTASTLQEDGRRQPGSNERAGIGLGHNGSAFLRAPTGRGAGSTVWIITSGC